MLGRKALELPRLSLAAEEERWGLSLPSDRQLMRASGSFDQVNYTESNVTAIKRFSCEEGGPRNLTILFASPIC